MHENKSSVLDPNGGSFVVTKYRNGEEDKNNFKGENSFEFNEVFERERRTTKHLGNTKFGIDKCMLYLSGPISAHSESPISIPTENIEKASEVAITKIA